MNREPPSLIGEPNWSIAIIRNDDRTRTVALHTHNSLLAHGDGIERHKAQQEPERKTAEGETSPAIQPGPNRFPS